jgi:hypothetical protein
MATITVTATKYSKRFTQNEINLIEGIDYYLENGIHVQGFSSKGTLL